LSEGFGLFWGKTIAIWGFYALGFLPRNLWFPAEKPMVSRQETFKTHARRTRYCTTQTMRKCSQKVFTQSGSRREVARMLPLFPQEPQSPQGLFARKRMRFPVCHCLSHLGIHFLVIIVQNNLHSCSRIVLTVQKK
ncbi:MAG: hypothetical protein K6B13_01905, partial [Prevotella sp.]|nr:hypothetical protein [Prevotella sp.]